MKIFIQVKPNAKIEKVEKISRLINSGDQIDYNVWVKEPAKESRANKAVIKALAEYFNAPKSSIRIISGATNKKKIININIDN